MSFINIDTKNSKNEIKSFLLADYYWIKSYVDNKYSNMKKNTFDYEECHRILYDDLKFDYALSFFSEYKEIYRKLGNKAWQQIKKDVYVRKSISILERNEYSNFINNPIPFIQDISLNRLYKKNIDKTVLSELLKEYNQEILNQFKVINSLNQQGLKYFNMGSISAPLDFLSDYLRGTKALLSDIHIIPDHVKNACKTISELILKQARVYRKYYNINYLVMPLHLPGILNRNDFEMFFYPSYNYILNKLLSEDFKLYIIVEGNVDRFADMISELNSNNVLLHFESLKIDKYQKYFKGKNTFISGFYPIHYLKYCSIDECLNFAEQLKQKVQGNDRYIFSTNKALYTEKDIKYENIIAVYKYLKNI